MESISLRKNPSVESNVSFVELFNPLSAACKCRVELRYRKSLLRGHYAYWVYDGHIGTSFHQKLNGTLPTDP